MEASTAGLSLSSEANIQSRKERKIQEREKQERYRIEKRRKKERVRVKVCERYSMCVCVKEREREMDRIAPIDVPWLGEGMGESEWGEFFFFFYFLRVQLTPKIPKGLYQESNAKKICCNQ